MPRALRVPCVGVMTMGHGSWVMWVMGQLCDGSHGSWVTKDDPFPSLLDGVRISTCMATAVDHICSSFLLSGDLLSLFSYRPTSVRRYCDQWCLLVSPMVSSFVRVFVSMYVRQFVNNQRHSGAAGARATCSRT